MYEHNIEKAKIQNSIKKIKCELCRNNESEFSYKEATNKELANYKEAEQTQWQKK